MPLSPQERHRRAEQAKRMHRDGVLGSKAVARKAAQRSVAIRQARASELASRLLQDHHEEVERALLHALRRGTAAQKLKAAEVLAKLSLAAERIGVAQEGVAVQRENLSREQILDRLTGTSAGQVLMRELAARAATVEGTAEEHPHVGLGV